ncbi:MAG: hypothetical protein ACLFQ3_09745 [Thiohalorhabdus sp.]
MTPYLLLLVAALWLLGGRVVLWTYYASPFLRRTSPEIAHAPWVVFLVWPLVAFLVELQGVRKRR